MQAIRTILADDNPEFLDSAERCLADICGLQLVGRATSGTQAVEMIAAMRADLVLVDLAMPGMNGLAVTRLVKSRLHAPKIILMSLFDDPGLKICARAAGADGCITKRDFLKELPLLLQSLFDKRGTAARA